MSATLRTRITRLTSFRCLRPSNWPTEHGLVLAPEGPMLALDVEATFEGPIHPVSGLIVDIARVEVELRNLVNPLEGRPVADASSLESLAEQLSEQLLTNADLGPQVRLVKMRLYAGRSYWVDVWL